MATYESDKTIKSNETLFAILEFIRQNDGADLGDIAAEIDRSKSTAHYHLKTLLEMGFVSKRHQTYQIGLRFLDYGNYARQKLDLFPAARDTVDELAKECDERVWCVTEENNMGVFIYTAKGTRAVDTDAHVGKRYPLHQISTGKAILAHLPHERVEEIIDQQGLAAITKNTITDRGDLIDELEMVRGKGYAINREESIEGMHAIGAPVLHKGESPLGAISIVGPANRLTMENIEQEYADILLGATNEIQLKIQYSE